MPLDPHLAAVELDLGAARLRLSDEGGFAGGAADAVGIVGGLVDVPGLEEGDVLTVKKMVIANAGADPLDGLNIVFVADEGETSVSQVRIFK